MTYHVQHLVLSHPDTVPLPQLVNASAVWLDAAGVESANIGTGVKKVWTEIYGSWGSFDAGAAKETGKGKGRGKGVKRKSGVKAEPEAGGKKVKKIMMPMMPSKSS
jgi:A/G-specific adenine glycosylase